MELFDRQAVDRLNQLGDYARMKIAQAIESVGANACVTGAGSMFRVHLKSKAPTGYRETYSDPSENKQIEFLVNFLYERGFMMINTCSAALSTVLSESEIDSMVDVLSEGLEVLRKN